MGLQNHHFCVVFNFWYDHYQCKATVLYEVLFILQKSGPLEDPKVTKDFINSVLPYMGFQILAQFRWGMWGFTDFMESQLITSTVSAEFLPIPSPSISKEQRQEGGACGCLGQRQWWFILWLVEFSSTMSLVLSFSEAAFLSCILMRTGSADCAQGWLRPAHGVAQHPRSLFLCANQLLPSGPLVPSHSPFKCHVLFRRTIFDRSAPQSAGPSPNSYGF